MATVKDGKEEMMGTLLEAFNEGQTSHKFSALVKLSTGYMGGGCYGPIVFIAVAAMTEEQLKKDFERILASSFRVSMDESSADEDLTKINSVISKGEIEDLFHNADNMQVEVVNDTYTLLHYGDSDESTMFTLFSSDK